MAAEAETTSVNKHPFRSARFRYLMAHLVLPFTRLESPGWGYLAEALGVFDNSEEADLAWRGLPAKTIRGKWHGYLMTLDLANWAQSCTWFLGRYYELDTQLVMRGLVKPGDTVIDVGANIGMITLLASRLVGPTGRVLSFEPNPNARARLKRHVELNGIENVEIYDVALSRLEGEQTLKVVGSHDGVGTLADIPLSSNVTDIDRIRTVAADNILPTDLKGRVFVKIDVEGYEPYALAGMRITIDRHHPYILTEFVPTHLRRAGADPDTLFAIMEDLGYVGFDIMVARAPFRYRFMLSPIKGRDVHSTNVLWIHQSATARFGNSPGEVDAQ